MIEALQAAALGAAGSTPGAPGASTAAQSPQANAQQIQQFTVAMQQAGQAPASSGLQAAGVQAASVASSQPSGGVRAVLSALDNLNGGVGDIKSLSQTLTTQGADFTPSEMLSLTVQCQEFMFQCSLTANVSNRTSDGITQLFRQQS